MTRDEMAREIRRLLADAIPRRPGLHDREACASSTLIAGSIIILNIGTDQPAGSQTKEEC